jgi:hypothetical protein
MISSGILPRRVETLRILTRRGSPSPRAGRSGSGREVRRRYETGGDLRNHVVDHERGDASTLPEVVGERLPLR